MNAAELRYAIYKAMTGLLNGDPGTRPVKSFDLAPPVPGEPLAIDVVTTDPYGSNDTRGYRLLIVETGLTKPADDEAAKQEDERLIRKYDDN